MTTRDAYIDAENGEEVPVYNEDDRREFNAQGMPIYTDEERAQEASMSRSSHNSGWPPVPQPLVIHVLDDDEDDDYEDHEDYDDDEYDEYEYEELNFEVYGDGGNGWLDEI